MYVLCKVVPRREIGLTNKVMNFSVLQRLFLIKATTTWDHEQEVGQPLESFNETAKQR